MDTTTESARSDTSPHVRWLVRADLPAVLRIERSCYQRDFTWGEEDFRTALKGSVIGKVAEVHPEGGEPQVVGFCVYEHVLNPRRIDVLNLAVCPLWRGRGVGRAMVAKLTRRVKPLIRATVRDSNLDAQLFFRAMGFRAIQVLRGYYDCTAEDAYVMEFRR